MNPILRPALSGVVLALLTAAGPAPAAEAELRTFNVTVDGKPAGTYKMAVRVGDDGTETVAAVAEVRVKTPLFTYTYEHQSLEVWKNGRLASVDATTNDDGKKHTVKAVGVGGRLSVTVNGKEHPGRADVLTTTGWRFPGPADAAREVVVFDTEDGAETAARLEPLGPAPVVVGGAAVEARRFRLTGKDLDVVWWFDPAGRPVRQEMTWDGHKVVLELTGITH